MQDLFAALISLFLIDPLSAEVRERLEAAQAPQAIVSDVASCIEKSAPALAARAWSDPWWVASTSFSVWAGTASLETVAAEAAPACAPVLRTAAPFLRESEA